MAIGIYGAQIAAASGRNQSTARVRDGLVNGSSPQTKAPTALLNRQSGKYSTQAFTFPLDVLSEPGMGNQGHYILFFINQTNHVQIETSARDNDKQRQAAIDVRKAQERAGGKQQIVGVDPGLQKAVKDRKQKEIESKVQKYGSNVSTVVIKRPATTQASHAIALYMPPSVSVQYGAEYEDTQIGAGAAIGAAAFDDIMSGQTLASTAGSALRKLGPEVADGMIRMALGAIDMIPGLEGAMEVVEMKRGYIRAPQMELAFKGIPKRSFSYDFKMIPKSAREADQIQKIIMAFKSNMLPRMIDGSVRRQIIPSTFNIQYMYQNNENTNLHKISTCVLESMDVTYGGDRYRTYEEGVPVETALSLSFKEMDLITAKKALEGF